MHYSVVHFSALCKLVRTSQAAAKRGSNVGISMDMAEEYLCHVLQRQIAGPTVYDSPDFQNNRLGNPLKPSPYK